MTAKIKTFPVVEAFCSVQGEGIFAGAPAWFIRFAGCDNACAWCDTDHTKSEAKTVDEIMKTLEGSAVRIVVLTGGNPCIHDLTPLVKKLKFEGFQVHVETQGTFLPGWLKMIDFLTLSPKGPSTGNQTDIIKLQQMCKNFRRVPKQLKVVVLVDAEGNVNQEDLVFAASVKNLFPHNYFVMQLGDCGGLTTEQYLKNYQALIGAVSNDSTFSDARILPQLHKLGDVR